MTTVFSGVPIGERIGTRLGQPDRIIQLAIGQQRGIGGDRGTANFSSRRRSKSSLSASLVDSPTGFAIATRLAVSKALNPIPQPPQTRSKSPIHPGNAGLCASEPDQASGRRYVFAAVHESGTEVPVQPVDATLGVRRQ